MPFDFDDESPRPVGPMGRMGHECGQKKDLALFDDRGPPFALFVEVLNGDVAFELEENLI
jgi:hypothetical protein